MSKNSRADSSMGARVIPAIIRQVLGEFVAHASEIPGLVSAVLYGSAARGELHAKSDIDVLLLFDTDHNPELGEEAMIAQRVGQTAAIQTHCPYTFSFVINNLRDLKQLDSDYVWNSAKEGIVIWSRPERILPISALPVAPYLLVTYNLSKSTQKDKRAVKRALYGYKTRRTLHGKVYESARKGLVQGKIHRLADGVILVPADAADKILTALQSRGVSARQTKIWV